MVEWPSTLATFREHQYHEGIAYYWPRSHDNSLSLAHTQILSFVQSSSGRQLEPIP